MVFYIFLHPKRVYLQISWKSSKNLPKEGKNLPSELHNFRTIDFWEILASFDRTNEVSRLQIWTFFGGSKNYFSKPGLDTGWMDAENRPWMTF